MYQIQLVHLIYLVFYISIKLVWITSQLLKIEKG